MKQLVGLRSEQSFSQTGQDSASKGSRRSLMILGEGVKRESVDAGRPGWQSSVGDQQLIGEGVNWVINLR